MIEVGVHCHWPSLLKQGGACHCRMIGTSWESAPMISHESHFGKPTLRLRACEFCEGVYDAENEQDLRKHEFLLTHGSFMTKEAYGNMVAGYWKRSSQEHKGEGIEATMEEIRHINRSVRALNMTEAAIKRLEEDRLIDAHEIVGEIGWGEVEDE